MNYQEALTKGTKILINLDKKIDTKKISGFYKFIQRRSSKEPIAYILKKKEFWSKNFKSKNL